MIKHFLIFILLSLLPISASAMDFFVSWQADAYTPYFYQGKVLPTNNSNIITSFELLENGRPINLSQRQVRWYLDNELSQSGVGLKTIIFKINSLRRDSHQLRIVLPQYNNGNDLEKIFSIPIVSPEAIIDAPYVNGLLAGNTNLLRGLFYFFNIDSIKELVIDWFVNNRSVSPSSLGEDILGLPISEFGGGIFNIGLGAKNKNNELEFASEKINLR
jgi:hypothetical protein